MPIRKKYLTEKEASEVTGFSMTALQNQRHHRRGLPYIKIGGRIRYDIDDVITYMNSHKIAFN